MLEFTRGTTRRQINEQTKLEHEIARHLETLRALRATGRKFENVDRATLLTESLQDWAMPARPVEPPIGSAGALCADSPLAGF